MLARFGRSKILLPVLHLPFGADGAMDSISIARESGADGVFLINQGMSTRELLALLPSIRARHPDLWLGINLLGYEPEEIIALPEAVLLDGVWADDAGVDSLDAATAAAAAGRWTEACRRTGWKGLYFGGTAFKTQTPIRDDQLPEVGRRAAGFVDVVTTSGPGTGIAVDVGRVKILREALGTHPLALASGVTPENVEDVLPYVDVFLVASGIESTFGRLDPVRTRALSERIGLWR